MRWYLVGSLVALVALAGCMPSMFGPQREVWRHDAEVACLKSEAVREGPGLVRIEPIEGPGMCGMDFPLKVSQLGARARLGYAPELRPPAPIPGAANQPPWPPAGVSAPVVTPRSGQSLPPWHEPSSMTVAPASEPGAPLSLSPPGVAPVTPVPPASYDFRRPYEVRGPAVAPPPRLPVSPSPVMSRPAQPDDLPPDLVRVQPDPPPPRPALMSPQMSAPRIPLGPPRYQLTGSVPAAEIKPAATLACPIVSALDEWIGTVVQPAALRWFGQPVVVIKQISSYSCRGMNGNPNAHISEHAFGNALDIAAFTLADGRVVTIKQGWNGAPDEQAFLRDIEGGACTLFKTVLAPGSNRFHYDHMHVDLMRRNNPVEICKPKPISGEVAYAQAAAKLAARRGGEPSVTGSIAPRRLLPLPLRLFFGLKDDAATDEGNLPHAVAGADGSE